RRAADVEADGRFPLQRQELLVAPHGERPGLDLRPADGLGERVVVVVHFERAEIVLAEVGGGDGVQPVTQAALEASDEGVGHERYLQGRMQRAWPEVRIVQKGAADFAFRETQTGGG